MLLVVAWLLAAAAIALVAGIFVAVVLGFAGLVGSEHQGTVIDVVAVVLFVPLAGLPFLLRRRTLGGARPGRS